MPDSETSSVVMVSNGEPDVVESEEVTQTPEDTLPTKGKSNAEDSSDSEESDEAEEAPEKVMVGMIADIKNLYQKYDKHGCLIWSDQTPDDLEEAAENEETLKYAVIVRYRKSALPPLVQTATKSHQASPRTVTRARTSRSTASSSRARTSKRSSQWPSRTTPASPPAWPA